VSAQLEIRSFRSVFALERRIYRIDTLRLNPGGVPLRGITYALTLVLMALLCGAVPPTAWLDDLVPWYLRDIGIPVGLATLLGALRVDGRPFHLAAQSIGGYALGPRRLSGLRAAPRTRRWHPREVLLIPDGSDSRFRLLRFRGPGAVLVQYPHLRVEWPARARADITLHPLHGSAGRASVVELAPGAVLEVRTK
jgi:hypothetical protein